MQLAKKRGIRSTNTVVHDRRPKIKVRGKPIGIILTKFVVQYHNHHIYGISYISNNKSATHSKLWKALETNKDKKRCN